jgi:hypothetical protein
VTSSKCSTPPVPSKLTSTSNLPTEGTRTDAPEATTSCYNPLCSPSNGASYRQPLPDRRSPAPTHPPGLRREDQEEVDHPDSPGSQWYPPLRCRRRPKTMTMTFTTFPTNRMSEQTQQKPIYQPSRISSVKESWLPKRYPDSPGNKWTDESVPSDSR